MKPTPQMRKLNMFLSILGLIAIYFVLQDRIADEFHIPLIAGLGILAIVSVIYGFKPVVNHEDDER